MKKICLLAIITFLLHATITAQKLTDRKKIQVALNKDTGYKKFRQQLTELTKAARGRNTNAAAVKTLFASNKTMLTNVYKRNNISSAHSNATTSVKPQLFNIKDKLQMAEHPSFSQVPPYLDHWLGREWDQIPNLRDGGSDTSAGKLAYTYTLVDNFFGYLGLASAGFKQTIRVPSDPNIIAARIEFQYSFHFTGWDTKGANFRPGLMLQCINFTSPSFISLPPVGFINIPPDDKWRRVKELTPEINIDEDLREFLYDEETSFVIEGNVIPGTEMVFRFGPGYRDNDTQGIYNCYHYGEFKLKKIVVSYMKAN